MILNALMVLTIVSMLFTFAGCLTFILVYRPVWPWHHGVYGRNLLMLCWWLGIWILAAFAHVLLPMPPEWGLALQLVPFTGIGTVVWHRVTLVPRAMRETREAPCPQCQTPDVDQPHDERG